MRSTFPGSQKKFCQKSHNLPNAPPIAIIVICRLLRPRCRLVPSLTVSVVSSETGASVPSTSWTVPYSDLYESGDSSDVEPFDRLKKGIVLAISLK